jgi:hypothetical protein
MILARYERHNNNFDPIMSIMDTISHKYLLFRQYFLSWNLNQYKIIVSSMSEQHE